MCHERSMLQRAWMDVSIYLSFALARKENRHALQAMLTVEVFVEETQSELSPSFSVVIML